MRVARTRTWAKPIRRAMLYGSALGIFEFHLNGQRVARPSSSSSRLPACSLWISSAALRPPGRVTPRPKTVVAAPGAIPLFPSRPRSD